MITVRQIKPGTILGSRREAQGYPGAITGEADDFSVYTQLFEVDEDHGWTPSLATRLKLPVAVRQNPDQLGAIERYVASHGSKQHLSQARTLFDIDKAAEDYYRH